jgi:hypothetical protein
VNLTDLPAGWWVPCGLPDGRVAIGDAEDPAQARVVAAIRRINAAVSRPHGRCPGGRRCRNKHAGSPEDYAIVAAWLDEFEPLPDGQLFTWRAALWA